MQKVGVIYNPSELNSRLQVETAKDAARALNLELLESAAGGENGGLEAVQSLIGHDVDAIYVPAGETVLAAAPSLVAAANQHRIPLFSGQQSFVNAGVLASITVNYENLGKQTR